MQAIGFGPREHVVFRREYKLQDWEAGVAVNAIERPHETTSNKVKGSEAVMLNRWNRNKYGV
jgi:hypothetical protein